MPAGSHRRIDAPAAAGLAHPGAKTKKPLLDKGSFAILAEAVRFELTSQSQS